MLDVLHLGLPGRFVEAVPDGQIIGIPRNPIAEDERTAGDQCDDRNPDYPTTHMCLPLSEVQPPCCQAIPMSMLGTVVALGD
jgi:hypothetical protein